MPSYQNAIIANRCLEAVLAFHRKSQIAKAPATVYVVGKQEKIPFSIG